MNIVDASSWGLSQPKMSLSFMVKIFDTNMSFGWGLSEIHNTLLYDCVCLCETEVKRWSWSGGPQGLLPIPSSILYANINFSAISPFSLLIICNIPNTLLLYYEIRNTTNSNKKCTKHHAIV